MNGRTVIYFFFINLVWGLSIFLAARIKKLSPRFFSVVSSAKVIWPAALSLNLLDGLSTWLCLARIGRTDIEGNPLFRFLFEQFGIGTGLLVGKIFFGSILLILLLKIISSHARVVFVLFFLLVCINNLANFILVGLA